MAPTSVAPERERFVSCWGEGMPKSHADTFPAVSTTFARSSDFDPPSREQHVAELEARDRFAPGAAGALAGSWALPAALGLVEAMAPDAVARLVDRLAASLGTSDAATFALLYAASVPLGALVGAGLSLLTRNLRAWLPLVLFLTLVSSSAVTVVLALIAAYSPEHMPMVSTDRALFVASVVFSFVTSLALPLRLGGENQEARTVRRRNLGAPRLERSDLAQPPSSSSRKARGRYWVARTGT